MAITASHNPAPTTASRSSPIPEEAHRPELYAAVENAIGRTGRPAAKRGQVALADLLTPYREGLASRVDLPAIRSAGLAILADSMHGAAGTLVSDILSGGPTRIVPFRAERDPLFGGVHPEPIAVNLASAAARVVEEGLDLAVAQDGDADRLGVLDRRGKFVSPHRVLALLLLHGYRRRGLRGGIAKTFSTSLLSTASRPQSESPSTRRRSGSSTSPT